MPSSQPCCARLGIDVDDIPGHVLCLDHGADLGDFAVVFLLGDFRALLLSIGLEIGLALAGLIRPTPGSNRQISGGGCFGERHGGCNRHKRRQLQSSHWHLSCEAVLLAKTGIGFPPGIYWTASRARQSSFFQPTRIVLPAPRARTPSAFGTLMTNSSLPQRRTRARVWSPR